MSSSFTSGQQLIAQSAAVGVKENKGLQIDWFPIKKAQSQVDQAVLCMIKERMSAVLWEIVHHKNVLCLK